MSADLYQLTNIECEACGQLLAFQGCGEYVCPNCGHSWLDDFGKVRLYLEQDPGATLAVVALETGVSVSKIKQFVAQERLDIVNQRYL